MGCSFVKHSNGSGDEGKGRRSAGGASSGDGSVGNAVDAPPPPAMDPRLPLTARQHFQIGKSWKGISRAMEFTGVNMFIKLFEEHNELLTLFTKFQELKTKEEQANSLELQEHAGLVMTTLDESISTLDNVDAFQAYLHQVGRSHTKVAGFKKEYFWKIQGPFLEAVKETLGDRYTENMEAIYTMTIQFILETLVKGYELAEKDA